MAGNIEDILENTALPDFEPGTHRQALRRRLLDELGRRPTMAARRKRILTIAVIALASLSTLAVAGVALKKISFIGIENGAYVFETKPATVGETQKKVNEDGSMTFSRTTTRTETIVPPGPDGTLNVEQTKKDLEEIESLRENNNRRILWISDTEYQGKSSRVIRYMYRLSDGRVMKMNEGVPGQNLPVEMRPLNFAEIAKRYHAQEGQLLPPTEETINGRTFVFERRKLTLSNGQEVIRSVGAPKEPQAEKATVDRTREGFALHANVPNPFNPQTTLRYELPEASDVQIEVYTPAGQKVCTLVNQQMPAGSHQVVWDGRDATGRNVASGTYLIRMQAPQFMQTQKVSLIR